MIQDLDFGSLYENYEKEQAYLSAEKEHEFLYNTYYNKVVKFDNTGDNLPVYLFVYDFNEHDMDLHCTVIRSYCPEFYPGESFTAKPHQIITIENFDLVEQKPNVEILF